MTTTPNKLYTLQTTGTNAGTWGDTLNNEVFTYVDSNLGGITTLSLASTTPIALTTTEARNGLLIFTGALLANIAVTTTALGVFWVENRTTGNFYVSLSNGVGNPVLIPQGQGRQVWSDATYGVRALGLPPPGSFLYLGAATPHPSLLATSSLVGEYLLCDGSSFLTTGVTANLYQAIGTTWGAGPLLPDLRGRGLYGKDNMGGSSVSRITTAGSGIDGTTVGSVGGNQSKSVLQANLPNVNFTVSDPGHSHVTTFGSPITVSGSPQNTLVASASGTYTQTAFTGISVASGGSGTALQIMNPAAICNVLIKI